MPELLGEGCVTEVHRKSRLSLPKVSPAQLPGAEAVVRFLPVAEGDAALVLALRAGQSGAPTALVDRYGAYVERLLMRVLGVDQDFEDLLQEVFVRALESIHELKNPAALKGWLGSVTLFAARGWLRQRQSHRRWLRFLPPASIPERVAPVAGPEVNEALARTYAILKRLPVDERIAFALRFIDGMEHAEAAEISRVSVATIKRRIARAEKRFLEAAERDPVLRDRVEQSERWRDR